MLRLEFASIVRLPMYKIPGIPRGWDTYSPKAVIDEPFPRVGMHDIDETIKVRLLLTTAKIWHVCRNWRNFCRNLQPVLSVPLCSSPGPSPSICVAARILDHKVRTATFQSHTEKTKAIKAVLKLRHVYRQLHPCGRYSGCKRRQSSNRVSLTATTSRSLERQVSESSKRRNLQTRTQRLFIAAKPFNRQ